jgi:SAM-dependent methyltransferase
VGAGAVVTRDVPAGSVVAGSPARVLRRLTDGEVARLVAQLESGEAIGRDTGAERHALVGPAHLWQQKRDFQIEFLRKAGLEPRHRLLDVGCGTLRGGIPLIAYLEPGHYTGIEVRAEALEAGRRELAEHGLEGRRPELLLCSDLSQLSLPARFDFAWAFSVLIHMDDATAAAALGFVARQLAPGGALYANVNLGSAPERRWQGFPVVTRELDHYEALAGAAGLEVEAIGALHELGHVSGDARSDAQVMLRFTAG